MFKLSINWFAFCRAMFFCVVCFYAVDELGLASSILIVAMFINLELQNLHMGHVNGKIELLTKGVSVLGEIALDTVPKDILEKKPGDIYEEKFGEKLKY